MFIVLVGSKACLKKKMVVEKIIEGREKINLNFSLKKVSVKILFVKSFTLGSSSVLRDHWLCSGFLSYLLLPGW